MTEPTAAQLQAILAKQKSRPGDGAMTFHFAKGEEVPADHPAVLAAPHLFMPVPAGRHGDGGRGFAPFPRLPVAGLDPKTLDTIRKVTEPVKETVERMRRVFGPELAKIEAVTAAMRKAGLP